MAGITHGFHWTSLPLPNRSDRDLGLFHLAFGALSALAMALELPANGGIRLLLLLAVYSLALPLVGWRRGHREWLRIWSVMFPLSLFQFYPQLVLAVEYSALVFNATGAPEIAKVPVFAGLLWSMPLFLVAYVGARALRALGPALATVLVLLTSALVFALAEIGNARVDLWYAQHVWMIGEIALFSIVPNLLLGLGAWFAYEMVRQHRVVVRVITAFGLMLVYLGSLSASYFLFERILV